MVISEYIFAPCGENVRAGVRRDAEFLSVSAFISNRYVTCDTNVIMA